VRARRFFNGASASCVARTLRELPVHTVGELTVDRLFLRVPPDDVARVKAMLADPEGKNPSGE